MQLCKNQTGTVFFKYHQINLQSTGSSLRAAVHTTDSASPPPPLKVLHLLYSTQYVATQLTSYESKHTEQGIRRTWGTQWAPMNVLTHHLAAFMKHGFTAKTMAPTPGTTTHTTVTWESTQLRQKMLNTMLGMPPAKT